MMIVVINNMPTVVAGRGCSLYITQESCKTQVAISKKNITITTNTHLTDDLLYFTILHFFPAYKLLYVNYKTNQQYGK